MATKDDFDHIQDLVEHVCGSNTETDDRSANMAKVNAETLGLTLATHVAGGTDHSQDTAIAAASADQPPLSGPSQIAVVVKWNL